MNQVLISILLLTIFLATRTFAMSFKPVLYMRKGCPFCTKLAVFLADTGLQNTVAWEYVSEDIQKTLTEKLGKATFPALQFAEGEYMLESGDIMEKFAKENNVDKSKLVVYNFFAQEGSEDASMMKTYFKLMKYGKQQAGGFPQLMATLESIE